MTDFIHEHHEGEPIEVAEETPLDEKTGQKRVYGYIFILFIVAFSLLVWSFLMNQRSTDQVLSELRGNASNLQSTLDRNIALEGQVDALQAERDALEEENEALRGRLEEAQSRIEAYQQAEMEPDYAFFALNYLWQLDRAVAEGNDEWAKIYIDILEIPSDSPKPLKD